MNALVGQEAKANFSLFWLIRDEGADDGGRKDGGDFTSTGAGGHLRGRCEFEVLHDGSEELQPSQIVSLIFRSGWQRRAIASFEDAQERAESLVAELDLGVIPAEGLIDKIERELDIPVCIRRYG
jgi:hypothetical protein